MRTSEQSTWTQHNTSNSRNEGKPYNAHSYFNVFHITDEDDDDNNKYRKKTELPSVSYSAQIDYGRMVFIGYITY